jgi:hypothetical protein
MILRWGYGKWGRVGIFIFKSVLNMKIIWPLPNLSFSNIVWIIIWLLLNFSWSKIAWILILDIIIWLLLSFKLGHIVDYNMTFTAQFVPIGILTICCNTSPLNRTDMLSIKTSNMWIIFSIFIIRFWMAFDNGLSLPITRYWYLCSWFFCLSYLVETCCNKWWVFQWVQIVLRYSQICFYMHMRQTSFKGFSKIKIEKHKIDHKFLFLFIQIFNQ